LILQASVIDAVNTAKGLGPGPKLTGPYGKWEATLQYWNNIV